MSGKKIFLITVVVAVVILLGSKWNEVKAMVAKQAGGGDASSNDENSSASLGGGSKSNVGSTAAPLNYGLLLKKGSKGSEVAQLQSWLYALNATQKKVVTRYTADGDFGTETENLLKAYMRTSQTTLNQAYPVIGNSSATTSTATPTYTAGSAAGWLANLVAGTGLAQYVK